MATGIKKIEKRNPKINKTIKESRKVIYPDWYSTTVITLLLQNGQTHFCGSTPKTTSFLFELKILIFIFLTLYINQLEKVYLGKIWKLNQFKNQN